MESLVNYIFCRTSRCTSVQNIYILSTPPGWLGGMLILMTKSPNKKPVCGFYSVISSLEYAYQPLYLYDIVQ